MSDGEMSSVTNQTALPARGYFLLEDWATLIKCEPKTLKALVKDNGVRILAIGNKRFIVAEWWWEDIAKIIETD